MSNWETKRFDDIAKIERGRFSPRPRNDPRYYGGDIPFVQTGDVSRAGIYLQEYSQTLNEEGLSVSKLFPKNTILMTIAANVGDVAILGFDSACPDSLVAFTPKEGVSNKWLFHTLGIMKNKFDSLSTQNAQKNLSLEKIKPVKIKVPPYEAQEDIAFIFDAWDIAIEKTKALIDAKERQFGWLKSKLLRTALEDYKDNIKSLPNVCKIRTGKKDVNQGNPDGQYPFFTCAKEHTFSDSYSYDMEAILLAGNGYIGNPILYRGKFEVYQRTYILHDFTHVDAEYLNYLLRRNLQKKIAQEKQEGAMSYIKLGTLQSIEIVVPPVDTQKRIASILNTAKKEITLLKKLSHKYRTQKRGLMQKLLSGKWPVKNKEAA